MLLRSKTVWIVAMTIGTLFLWSCASEKKDAPEGIEHIIVIGVDGMSPDGIQKANTPMLDSIMQNGAFTMHARAVLPSSSSPNWASMIMGADTEQHGVTSNGWEKEDHQLPPVLATDEDTFPTIFTLFKDQKPEAQVGAIYDWDGFGRLFEKSDVDFDIDGDHEDGTTKDAVAYINEHKPEFTFVHLDHVDHAGHAFGHGSLKYYASVQKADSLITEIVKATKDAGIFDSTLFLICADHGGIGFGHGGESVAEMNIPFILYGKGIKKGYEIEEAVYQYDNAATVAYAMELETPYAWIGRPVKGAFLGHEKPVLVYKRKDFVANPQILPSGGYFEPAGGVFRADSTFVVMQNPNAIGEILYTVDGSNPTATATKYKDTFYINRTTVIKAAIFQEGSQKSGIVEANFRLIPKDKEKPIAHSVYYIDGIELLPKSYDNLTPVLKGMSTDFSFNDLVTSGLKDPEQVSLVFEGDLEIDTQGEYTFFTNSDDGSKLYVDGKLVADNDGDHGVRERSGKVVLDQGRHLVRVEYFNGGGGFHLDVKYQGEGIPKQIIPANKLYRNK
ncbi:MULTISPECIES: alkaline phosphatase family protein [Flavobacteriaceae]|uniref:alkaline phosphatase family protein n=1 Tax=Flavobacteriaceae TaxID=49546 RepID=UPI001C0E9ECC|nr:MULTISPECIES: alkaline phosphatase family protein [Allomuricauda]MDC6366239.1 alkaline phosphatase family protein [Muricauda sp. AC10]